MEARPKRLQVTADTYDITPADELFAAVDGHIVRAHGSQWEMRVSGIHSDRERYWVQLMLDGPRHIAATFRANPLRPTNLLDEVDRWFNLSEPDQPVYSYVTV